MTRKAAAQQLGEVVKLHPHELNTLLSKVWIKCLKGCFSRFMVGFCDEGMNTLHLVGIASLISVWSHSLFRTNKLTANLNTAKVDRFLLKTTRFF